MDVDRSNVDDAEAALVGLIAGEETPLVTVDCSGIAEAERQIAALIAEFGLR